MSKPNNSISKIKLPGENTGRPIVPYYVGDIGGSSVATLPTLFADSQFVITTQNQNIDGTKTFTSATYFESNVWVSGTLGIWDNTDGDYVDFQCSNGAFRIYSNYYGTEWQFGYDDAVAWMSYEDWDDNQYTYSFPTQSGTLGLQVDIVDLTSLS